MPPKETYSFRLSAEVMESIQWASESTGKSRGEIIEDAIRSHLPAVMAVEFIRRITLTDPAALLKAAIAIGIPKRDLHLDDLEGMHATISALQGKPELFELLTELLETTKNPSPETKAAAKKLATRGMRTVKESPA